MAEARPSGEKSRSLDPKRMWPAMTNAEKMKRNTTNLGAVSRKFKMQLAAISQRDHYTMLCYASLYYTILYYTILYYTILYYTILYYTILYYTILYYTILYYTILYHTILYSTLLYLLYTIFYILYIIYCILYTIVYYTTSKEQVQDILEGHLQGVGQPQATRPHGSHRDSSDALLLSCKAKRGCPLEATRNWKRSKMWNSAMRMSISPVLAQRHAELLARLSGSMPVSSSVSISRSISINTHIYIITCMYICV